MTEKQRQVRLHRATVKVSHFSRDPFIMPASINECACSIGLSDSDGVIAVDGLFYGVQDSSNSAPGGNDAGTVAILQEVVVKHFGAFSKNIICILDN